MNNLFLAQDYKLERSQITLLEIIGEGQFGDVHKGVCTPKMIAGLPLCPQEVAVKTCKTDNDPEKAEKFLEEACMFFNNRKTRFE